MAKRELWSGDGGSPYAFSEVGEFDANSHPALHGLERLTREDSHSIWSTTHNHRDWGPEQTRYHGAYRPEPGYTHSDIWHDMQENAYKTRDPKVSDKVRGLIHVPHIAADAAEEEGHEKLAHFLRHAEHVHTYYGSNANHHDVLFHHNGMGHLLIRQNTPEGLRRYHLVGPLPKKD